MDKKTNKYGATLKGDSGFSKIKKTMNIPDDFGTYLLQQKVIPAVKDLLFDGISNLASIIIFKKPLNKHTGFSALTYKDAFSTSSYVSDNKSYNWSNPVGKRWDFNDIIFPTRSSAESFLSTLDDYIEQCGQISVLTVYKEVDQSTPRSWTDGNYGWTNLAGATPVHTIHGWVIDFPPVRPLVR